MIYITIAIIIFAAFFKAVADTLQHHFETSIFRKKDVRWWNPAYSWKYVNFIPFTKYRLDAWHLTNSLMIISFICLWVFGVHQFNWWIDLIAAGIIYNIAFSFFYDKVLR